MAYTEPRKGGHIGRFRVDGTLKSTRLFTTKRDALAEAERQERSGKTSEWIDRKASSVTLTDYFQIWQAARADRAPRTLEDERERFVSLIEPAFGRLALKRLDHAEIARWAATMPAKRTGAVASQARRRDAVRLLVAILDGAVDARRLPRNVARTPSGKVPYLPKQSKTKPHRYLSFEQLRRVADATGDEQARVLILLAGMTGLRWGEVSALTVADVDPLRGRLRVDKAYTRLGNGELVLGDTKTHAARAVPIGAALCPLLESLTKGKGKGALLFATAEGAPLRRESFSRNAFEPAVRAAGHAVTALQLLLGLERAAVSGIYDKATVKAVRKAQVANGLEASDVCGPATWAALALADRERRGDMTQGEKVSRTRQLAVLARLTLSPGVEDFDRLTLHDLRHTAASLAVAGGGSVKAVQTLLGHESAKLTLDTYAGLFDSDLDALGDAMSAAFEASSAHHVLTGGAHAAPGVTALRPAKRS